MGSQSRFEQCAHQRTLSFYPLPAQLDIWCKGEAFIITSHTHIHIHSNKDSFSIFLPLGCVLCYWVGLCCVFHTTPTSQRFLSGLHCTLHPKKWKEERHKHPKKWRELSLKSAAWRWGWGVHGSPRRPRRSSLTSLKTSLWVYAFWVCLALMWLGS